MDFRELEVGAWSDPAVARAYRQTFARATSGAVPALLDAVEPAANPLLDVATGPGTVAQRAVERGARVVALDLSLPMLRGWWTPGNSARAVRGDAESLPFSDGAFSAVVCNLGLLHFPRPERAIAEAGRVLRGGGRAAWSVWGIDADLVRVIPESLSELELEPRLPAGPGFFRFADESTFRATIAGSGLAAERTLRARWTVRLADASEFWTMFADGSARTRAGIRSLAPADQERLRLRVADRLERYRDAEGLAVPASAVVGVGRKP
jgi:SAM-dependent methyltransferase